LNGRNFDVEGKDIERVTKPWDSLAIGLEL